MKISNTFLDDDDVDDLGEITDDVSATAANQDTIAGFDPFHETQKGLADLLESESKAAEAQQYQQQVKVGHMPGIEGGINAGTKKY